MTAATSARRRGATVRHRRHRLRVPPSVNGRIDVGSMSGAMVDRLFWRAGFGPSAQDRKRWTGRPLAAAVDWLLTAPSDPLIGAAPTNRGRPLDPTGDDTDLVLSWVDRMIRVQNPFVERMTFFWHRHWANSREQVNPPQLLLTQNALFREFARFGARPKATFHELALAVTQDPSMLRYLNGESNQRSGPNENYARELMELFCLGPTNAAGKPNYSESDVQQGAKALTGWKIDDDDPDAVSATFDAGRWYNGPKPFLGHYGNWKDADVVSFVLAHPAHGPFLVRKLWHEFIVSEPPASTLADLVRTYVRSGLQLRPLLRRILTNPLLFESLREPNMVKPPVVYVAGMFRALGRTITDSRAADYLSDMGQSPYFPPDVSGWEGGLSWLNTNTTLARFGFAADLLDDGTGPVDDTTGSAASIVARAAADVGSPWLAPATRSALAAFVSRTAPKLTSSDQRTKRAVTLRALILAGPDAQVM